MQIFNIRSKLHLYRGKVAIIALLLLGCVGHVNGQRNVAMNNPNYDDRFLSYGFLIGIHTTTYQLKYSDRFISRELDSLYSISPSWSPGFSLGFIVNLRMSEFFDLRLLPKVAFYEHRIQYLRLDAPNIDELVETTIVELPLLIKYKSERRGNFRMYIVGGIKPGFEASGKNDVDEISKENLPIKAFNLSLDAGFGIDMYYPLFKFSPEIRFSKGITNMLGNENNELSAGINRLNTNTITLYLLFQ
jgi:hypothetical protein